ncbi:MULTISPECIES: cache domain-containing protein [unclassified Blastococcus]
MTVLPGEGAAVAAVVAGAVERVFAAVAALDPPARVVLGVAPGRADDGGAALEQRARALLAEPGTPAAGLGLVAAPRADRGLRLLWWQDDGAHDRPAALHPDLRPGSAGFYDYPAADWFAVPRATGARHVVGPYVDVHGTGRYLLTLTAPVVAGGRFLGVVGADVPVSRFEAHVLGVLGTAGGSFAVVGADGRVVLSTSARWLVGALAPDLPAAEGAPLPGLPWRLHLLDRPPRP